MKEKWISVNAGLPTKEASYLVHCRSADREKPLICTAWYDPRMFNNKECFGWSGLPLCWINSISHWMELPVSPDTVTVDKVVDPNRLDGGNRFVPDDVRMTVLVYRGDLCGCILMYEADAVRRCSPEAHEKLWLSKIKNCIAAMDKFEEERRSKQ